MLRYGAIMRALREAGFKVQDESQPGPEGMFHVGGFGEGVHAWSVYAKGFDRATCDRVKRIVWSIMRR